MCILSKRAREGGRRTLVTVPTPRLTQCRAFPSRRIQRRPSRRRYTPDQSIAADGDRTCHFEFRFFWKKISLAVGNFGLSCSQETRTQSRKARYFRHLPGFLIIYAVARIKRLPLRPASLPERRLPDLAGQFCQFRASGGRQGSSAYGRAGPGCRPENSPSIPQASSAYPDSSGGESSATTDRRRLAFHRISVSGPLGLAWVDAGAVCRTG